MKQGASRLDSTILFSNWKRDKSSSYDHCFNFDWSMITLADINVSLSEEQLLDLQQIIKHGYPDFIKTYSILASHSVNYPLIDKPRFEVFVKKANLSGYMLSIEKSMKVFDITGCGKDLGRPQFLKAILNLIYAKYLRPKAQE